MFVAGFISRFIQITPDLVARAGDEGLLGNLSTYSLDGGATIAGICFQTDVQRNVYVHPTLFVRFPLETNLHIQVQITNRDDSIHVRGIGPYARSFQPYSQEPGTDVLTITMPPPLYTLVIYRRDDGTYEFLDSERLSFYASSPDLGAAFDRLKPQIISAEQFRLERAAEQAPV